MTKISQAWLVIGALVVLNGCASVANFGSFGKRAEEVDPSRRYQVEMANMVGQPVIFEGNIENNMTVQAALEKSGAIRRYRNMDISILRIVEGTGQPLVLKVSYQPAKKMVSAEQDYALLPGDRVLIEPATGLLDRLTSGG
jgi:hypothetical protein